MKTLVNVLSAVSIATVLVATPRLFGRVGDAPDAPAAAARFTELPLGEPRPVQLEVHDDEIRALSAREKADQYRDWLLLAVAGSAGLTPEELNEATFDLPAVRAGFMRETGSLEFGEVRSVYLGDGMVAALVPAGRGAAERLDLLGEVADRHRKNVGERPDSVAVFEYALAADGASATLTRRPAVPWTVLFGREAGYHESRIAGLADFQDFMRRVDDVTYGRMDGGALVLGGRKVRGRPYRGIRVEDVAAIWASAGAETQQGSGFSLDPAYDFDKLARLYEREVTPFLLHEIQAGRLPLGGGDLREVRDAVRARDIDPYFRMMDHLRQNGNGWADTVAELLLSTSQEAQFQVARYDGSLRGTEVGMVLFYTDLMAKLWSLDYMGSTPSRTVPDFVAQTERPVSPIYRKQLDSLSKTRLWFGSRDTGFQLASDGATLLMERVATRVYAASSSGFSPGVEAPANAASQAFLGWWNDHYDEIARYEPEYERLNQIMKWSLVVGWLKNSGAGGLDFLAGVPVDTTSWFPRWAARHPELRFRQWSRIGFHAPGFRGSSAESLPRLSSGSFTLFGKRRYISGGVSLGGPQTFVSRPRLAASVSPLRRRGNLNYGAWNEGAGGLSTVDGWGYRISRTAPGRLSVQTSTPAHVRLRGARGELARVDIERVLAKNGSGLRVETSAGGNRVGELHVRSSRAGLRVAWQGRDLSLGQSLAHRMSVSPHPGALLRGMEEVEEAFALDGGGYLVRLQGSERWMKVVPERVNTVDLPPGWDARVAGVGGQPQLVAWMDDEVVRALVKRDRLTHVKRGSGPVPPDPVRGDVRLAAGDATRDLTDFRRRGDLHLHDRLAESDRLAREGRYDEAGAALDELDAAYQKRPDVVMRRALLDLSLNRPGLAVTALREAGPGRLADRDRLFDEINARIRHASPQEAQGLHRVAQVLDWNDLRARGRVQGTLLPVHNGVGIELRLERETLDGVPAGANAMDEIARGDAVLYVQDAPGLNNLDWSPGSVGRTLHAAITGRRGRLERLPESGLEDFQPGRIYATAQNTEYRLHSRPAPALSRYRARSRERCAPREERRVRPRAREEEECRRVYVVTIG